MGGGNGWSIGAPYGRCKVTGGWRGGAVGMAEERGGIISGEEDGGPKNEGLTRLVVRLLVLLGWEVSRRGIKEVDVDWGGEASCKVGTVPGIALGGQEGRGGVAEDW